jgi:hypothetical protein
MERIGNAEATEPIDGHPPNHGRIVDCGHSGAFMVGVEDPKTVGRWASERRLPKDLEVERRLRDAHQIFRLLLTKESPYTVRAWFVGLNPQLDDESPAAAIRDGRTRDVLVAAKAFLAGG